MKKRLSALCVLLLLSALFCTSVQADMGPKDKLTVYVTNPPAELYYLDLLYEGDNPVYPNLTEDELAALNPAMLQAIREDRYGLTAALTEGTGIPTFGQLTGTAEGLRMKHTFGYYGLPETYRIILVTESGSVRVSDEFTRRSMQSSITYDYQSGQAQIPPLWKQYALQLLCTLAMTLILEGGILLLFRFSLRKNGGQFLLTNLATQIVLTAVVGHALIAGGTISAFLTMIVCELAILAAETVVYAFWLREHSRSRRIAYGITANLISWAAGLLSLEMLYDWIVSIA